MQFRESMRTSVSGGLFTGICLGILHPLILATGGLYATEGPAGILLSFLAYVGLMGIVGAIVGALVGLMQSIFKFSFWNIRLSAPLLMCFLYIMPWIAFLTKQYLGRNSVAGISAAAGIVFLLLIVLAGRRARHHKPSGLKKLAFYNTGGIVAGLSIVCLICYLGVFVLSFKAKPKAISASDNNPLDSLRYDAISAFVGKAEGFSAKKWNLLLLTIDTLRADHLSCYGYYRDTSPAIDALAASGMKFTHAFCERPKTSPSFATMLTGTYPSYNGVHQVMQVLDSANVTLAEILKKAGWTTAAVITNGNLYPVFGFDQGFDTYVYGHKDARTGADLTIEWLEKNAEKAEPWSLWVHFTDPHTPYSPPYPYDILFAGADSVGERSLDKHIALYDGEVRFADEQVRRIISWLEEHNFLDNTLIVFTADHGESLGEHDYYYEHGLHAYEPSVHVPLIISAGSLITPSSETDALVGTIDLLPTILDALAVDVPDAVQGHSFLPVLLGMSEKGPESFIYMEAGYADHDMSGRVCALRKASSKYVHRLTLWAKRPRDPIAVFWSMNARLEGGLASDEFYDLRTDPAEMNNLLDDKKGVSKKELQTLLDFDNSLVKKKLATEGWKASEVDAKTSDALRSIGYIK